MVTLDVTSFYTNIPHSGGLEAVEFFLDKMPVSKPSARCIRSLMELVLTTNHLLFKNDYCLQIKGSAMGSTTAPNDANLYMGLFEDKFVLNSDTNRNLSNILLYRRYIDDLFFIC